MHGSLVIDAINGGIVFQDRNTGTSVEFIALIIVSATFPSLIRNLLAVFYPQSPLFNNKSFLITLIVDFCMIILPVELMVTVWNNQSHVFFGVTCCCIAILIGSTFSDKKYQRAFKSVPFLHTKMKDCPFVSYFRAYTNIFTGFSILAVDFAIYPPYFYKSRLYGTALMDSGLGFYVISNAIVSPEARGLNVAQSTKAVLIKATKDNIPLIFAGTARYFLLTSIEYHVPVQEYGVHWNFFFTLAFVKASSTILLFITPSILKKFLGPVIIVIHQCCLMHQDYIDFLVFGSYGNGSRSGGFVNANREGIFGSIGFLAIYLIGVRFGSVLMKSRETILEWIMVLLVLIVCCTSSWIMFEVTRESIQEPCRKFANLSYTFFIVGITSLLIVEGLAFDIIITYMKQLSYACGHFKGADTDSADKTCGLLQASNYNGLLFFAVANILTGLVNLSIHAQSKPTPVAFNIVTVYMLILSALFLYMYRNRISFKSIIWRTKRKKDSNSLHLNHV